MLPNYSIFSIGDSKIDTFLEAVLNLFRDRLRPMLKQFCNNDRYNDGTVYDEI